jgi:hypothetical protein
LSEQIADLELTASEAAQLKKLMRLFFLGQIVGLPTLHSILNRLEIKSNNEQIKYKKLCKSLSNNKIHAIFEFIFEQQLEEELKILSEKDTSNWSREIVTAVLDDSVFKQWLQSQDGYDAYEGCYKKSFSGQVGHAVYGFQVVTFGLSIEGMFYPLYFQSVKKKEVTDKEGKPTIDVAIGLIKKWGQFKERLSKKDIILPYINFSCDSGYSDVLLSEICFEKGLTYISVPKKNHYFIIQDIKTRLDDWIKNEFIIQEQKHMEAQAMMKEAEKTPFVYRFRAFYISQNREVTLLAFRLNGSKKVSIIYTTDKNIKAKTLRRHWFQRTYIEQFFKLLKHYLTIQQTITTTKHEFEVKLLRFAFIALHLQGLVKFLRRKIRAFKNKGFGTLRYLMQADKDIIDLLKQNFREPSASNNRSKILNINELELC